MSQPDPDKPEEGGKPQADAPAGEEGSPARDSGVSPAASVRPSAPAIDAARVDEAPPSPEERVAQAQADLAKLRDQLLRTAADFDNFRKRTRRELEDANKRGKESAIKELLPVFDNLERAASHADSAPDVASLAEGLRIVLKQFLDSIDKLGLKRVATVGQPFDPSVHEAIQHLPSTEHPAGAVLAEVQAGYTLGDRLVRAAMVVVSKGPPEDDAAAT